jgi:hypothetical protein
MTLAEAREIFRYWETNPPTHLIVQAIAGLLGWSPPPALSPPPADIAAAPPPGLTVTRTGSLGMPPPILDPATLRTRNQARAAELAHSPLPSRDGS